VKGPIAAPPSPGAGTRPPARPQGPAHRYELTQLAGILLAATLLGLATGYPLPLLVLGVCGYLGLHFYQLLRLSRITRNRQRIRPPYPPGLWGEIYRAIARHQERSRKRKRGLARFAARFRDVASAVPDALVILDKELRVDWSNAASQSLLGFAWPAAGGRPIMDLVGYPALRDYIEVGDYHQPMDFVPPHNNAIVLSIRVAPFGGKKRQRLLVARDITKVYHLNQIRRDFVANVSHELRTPLTVINGFVESLLDAPGTPEPLRHPLDLMHSQAARMASIIQDLLTLSRLEMDEKASDQIPIDMPQMLTHIYREALALSPSHLLQSEIDPELWLKGNEGEIRSAVSNLLFNAVKHTPPGTQVHIGWRWSNSGPLLSIQDDGEGIAAEHVPRLTERFYRVDKGRSRASGGTGLGLAIVKHVLSRHDAELHISSTPGEGSIFTCRFPMELAIPAPEKAQEASPLREGLVI
jgi:two-component system, OmpR family, phosphate regulon sensor histidine kinase PhoR